MRSRIKIFNIKAGLQWCSAVTLHVKPLLSQMFITVLEIVFEHMYVCVFVLCLICCFGLGFFKYILDTVINSNYSC